MKINLDFKNASLEMVKDVALDAIRGMKSVVFSTVDKNGEPSSRIIDVMFREGDALYFMTCVVKPFYFELLNNKSISITTMNEDYIQVRLKGKCEIVNNETLAEMFEKNPELGNLFPSDDNSNLQAFRIYEGKGEIFDLSGQEVKAQRARFAFGGKMVNSSGCVITDDCINCGKCAKVCPFDAISKKEHYEINPTQCDECGMCYIACPVKAIELPKGL